MINSTSIPWQLYSETITSNVSISFILEVCSFLPYNDDVVEISFIHLFTAFDSLLECFPELLYIRLHNTIEIYFFMFNFL